MTAVTLCVLCDDSCDVVCLSDDSCDMCVCVMTAVTCVFV